MQGNSWARVGAGRAENVTALLLLLLPPLLLMNATRLLLGEAQLDQRLVHVGKLLLVVPRGHLGHSALLVTDLVVLPLAYFEWSLDGAGRLAEHLEDVVVALA